MSCFRHILSYSTFSRTSESSKCQNIAFANKNFEQFSILMWGHSRVPFERHTFCPPSCDALDSSSVCIVFPLNTLRGIKCKNIVFPWSPTQKNPSHSQTRDCKEFQTRYFIPKTQFRINWPIFSETEDGIAHRGFCSIRRAFEQFNPKRTYTSTGKGTNLLFFKSPKRKKWLLA